MVMVLCGLKPDHAKGRSEMFWRIYVYMDKYIWMVRY